MISSFLFFHNFFLTAILTFFSLFPINIKIIHQGEINKTRTIRRKTNGETVCWTEEPSQQ